jgi:murein DD-endopeptidase MepM/ murein hydrolase activator NlpD
LGRPTQLPESRPVALPASNFDLFRRSLPLQLPASGYVTRGFEPTRGHLGIDIAGKQGSPVVAAADGYILFAGWTYEAGNMLILAHGGGYFTFYKHNQSLLKSANSFVKHGEPIALLGNTGAMSHGPHLHFEVWKDGAACDPSEYVLNYHLY